VTFRLDQQIYALPVEPIAQIIEMVTIMPLLGVNPSVQGAINVRGIAVPVINLRRHLNLTEKKLQLHTPIILVRPGEWLAGLIVDEVTDVITVNAGQITNPMDRLPESLGDAPFLQGVLHTPRGAIVLLNLEHLLAFDRARLAAALETLSTANDLSGNSEPASAGITSADELTQPQEAPETLAAAENLPEGDPAAPVEATDELAESQT
jgi:purine-binding chemotaxis protein CheW